MSSPVTVSSGLKAAGDTHPGLQRDINEDRFHYDPARGLFMVIDGVGGQAAGEKAAETALGIIRTRLERETGTVEDRVRDAITLANNEIHRLASLRADWSGMACVLTVAAVVNGEAVVGHVGDTRLYKLRGGRIEKLTRDHSPVGEREDAGEISELDAMRHPRRNEVYRDVGSERHEPSDPDFIDLFRAPFEPDAALLLCSDGLTDCVTSDVIRDVVEEYAGHPYEVVRALVDGANDAGGKDNVTVVYVERHRFTQGEDTRPLSGRVSGVTPVVEAPREEKAHAAPVRSARLRRWRIAALILLLSSVAVLALYSTRDRWMARSTALLPVVRPLSVVVQPGQSISDAVARVDAGTEVIVEAGEYREQLRLKDGVRVVSRPSRGASIRLPGGGSESDAAVVAFDVEDAGLVGFRIVGDAATPLGTGVFIRNSDVALVDVEIVGARNAAVEYAGDSRGVLLACHLHDNPGVGVAIRGSASPRIAHNLFMRNATAERATGPLVIESGTRPTVTANVFQDLRPEGLVLPPTVDAAAVRRDNWFPGSADRNHPPEARPRGRGRR
jgi:PPM family protein phosphatase